MHSRNIFLLAIIGFLTALFGIKAHDEESRSPAPTSQPVRDVQPSNESPDRGTAPMLKGGYLGEDAAKNLMKAKFKAS